MCIGCLGVTYVAKTISVTIVYILHLHYNRREFNKKHTQIILRHTENVKGVKSPGRQKESL